MRTFLSSPPLFKYYETAEQFNKDLEADPFYAPARTCLKVSEDAIKQRIKTEAAVHLFKGIAYAIKGMFDKAMAEYKKALKINPNYADAHSNLGVAYLGKGM